MNYYDIILDIIHAGLMADAAHVRAYTERLLDCISEDTVMPEEERTRITGHLQQALARGQHNPSSVLSAGDITTLDDLSQPGTYEYRLEADGPKLPRFIR